jgi:uncharacterized membrane protein YvbJ
MNCPNCGDINPDDARFCGSCGAELRSSSTRTSEPEGSPVTPVSRQRRPDDEAVSTELKIGIAIATAVIPLIGIVMGIMYLTSTSPSKKAAGRLWLIVAGVMFLLYCCSVVFLGGF